MMIRSALLTPLALIGMLGAPLDAATPPPQADPANPQHHALTAEYNAAKLGISLLVMIDGKIVFEQYDNGGFPEWAHELASGTKSFAGVVAAIAADEGLLTFDERLVDTLPEWRYDPLRSQITLRQLLSLTSGLETKIGSPPTFADAITKRAVDDPGTDFTYGSTAFQVFGEVLTRKLKPQGMTVEQYYRAKLFDPLEINVARWRKGADGNPHLPSGVSLTARDWAKFGQMVLQQGTWEGKPIVARETLAQCFQGTEANPGYGLTWWLARPVPRELVGRERVVRRNADFFQTSINGPGDVVMAAGAGNQRLILSPSLKLVVVRQAVGIRQALLGTDIDYSDVELMARLLYGLGADGKPATTGDQLEVVDASAEERFMRRMRDRFDANADGELSPAEMQALNAAVDTLSQRFGG